MKSSILLTSYILIFSLITFESGGGAYNYGPLIKEVLNKYRTRGVIMASTKNYLSLPRFTISLEISRDMSTRGVLSVVVNFMQLRETLQFYHGKIHRPLVVIFIDEIIELHIFQKVTLNTDMSYPLWLILFTGDKNEDSCKLCYKPIGNLFNLTLDSEMLVSCCNSAYIREFWSETGNHTNEVVRGRWINETRGILWYRHKSLYNRRHSVDKGKFRVLIVKGSSYIWKGRTQLHGFLGHVLNELCRVMNLTAEIIETVSYGSLYSKPSNWTGGIGAVAQGAVHLGADDFTMTSERLNVVDFTLPFTLGRSRLWIKKPHGSVVHWGGYLKALHPDIWIVIIILLLITPLLLTMIKYKRKYHLSDMIWGHYLNIWGIFCQQGLSEFPKETPSRIVYISIFISAIVTSAVYSASLCSYLATSSLYLPFSTMEDFANAGTYKLIVLKDGVNYDRFKAANDTISKKMWKLMKPRLFLPQSLDEAYKQICNENVAFYTNVRLTESVNIDLPCEMVSIETRRIDSLAMIMPRNSQYKKLVDYHLQRFRDNGMLMRLHHKHSIKKTIHAESNYEAVEFWSMVPILVALIAGISVSLIIFLIERIYCHFYPAVLIVQEDINLRKKNHTGTKIDIK